MSIENQFTGIGSTTIKYPQAGPLRGVRRTIGLVLILIGGCDGTLPPNQPDAGLDVSADPLAEAVGDAAQASDAGIDAPVTDSMVNTLIDASPDGSVSDGSVETGVDGNIGDGGLNDSGAGDSGRGAEPWPVGWREVNNNTSGGQGFGSCLGLSADGRWMVSAWDYWSEFVILERAGSGWAERFRLNLSTMRGWTQYDGENSCAISRSGEVAAFGMANERGRRSGGLAFVAVREGDVWSLRSQLLPQDPADGIFGTVHAVSAGGDHVVVSNGNRWIRISSSNRWQSWTRETIGTHSSAIGHPWAIDAYISNDGAEFYDADGHLGGSFYQRESGTWRFAERWPAELSHSGSGQMFFGCNGVYDTGSSIVRCQRWQRSLRTLTAAPAFDIQVREPIPGHNSADMYANSVILDNGEFVMAAFDYRTGEYSLFESRGNGNQYRRFASSLPRNRVRMDIANNGRLLVVNVPFTTHTYERE